MADKADVDDVLASLWADWEKAASEGRAVLARELRSMYLDLLVRQWLRVQWLAERLHREATERGQEKTP